jgi:tRNA pseudouridine55 synthase
MPVRARSGVLVIDKPRGPTSHDVVARVRRALGTREVGHAGTLDPMATGVLVVAIGEATKLVPWLTAQAKVYEATIAFGFETDTLDAEGRETRRAPLDPGLLDALAAGRGSLLAPRLRAALEAERARTVQIPPAFSAIHKDGERAYARARRGEAVELAPRDVRVHRLEVVACSAEPPWLSVLLEVDKGYYVRGLARDLAQALSTLGHLTSLRRLRSGCFTIDRAIALDTPGDRLADGIEPLAGAASRALPVARLSQAGERDARHGRPLQAPDLEAPTEGACAWLGADGALVAVGERGEDGRGRVLRGFAPGNR